jgi:hypothetical protein
MKTLFLSLALILLCIFPTGVSAQYEIPAEEESHSFNFIVEIYEELIIFFTFNEERKIERRLEFAEKRLSMINSLPEDADSKLRERLERNYEKHMERALRFAERRSDKLEERVQKVNEAKVRHIKILEDGKRKSPGRTLEEIKKEIENIRQQYGIPNESENSRVSEEPFGSNEREISREEQERERIDRDKQERLDEIKRRKESKEQ